ncbi:MAG: chorismate mutase [Stellaceae bacterium]
MSLIPSDLEELRRRIDEIDDRLQDLLIERFEIVLDVAAQKRGGSVNPHQPAREAEIIRRMVARNRWPLQAETLVRMWREMISGTTRLQGNFRIAVYSPPEAPGFWDIARDHYGSHTAMQGYQSAGAVIRAISEGQAEIGVLPMPQEEEPDPWWRMLASSDGQAARVIARLPFGANGNTRADRTSALAIGRGIRQPTGHDRTLLAAEIAPDISRGRIFALLTSLGLEGTFLASCSQANGANILLELSGFVELHDPRLQRFRAQLGQELFGLVELGGYAEPLQFDAAPARPIATADPVAARG